MSEEIKGTGLFVTPLDEHGFPTGETTEVTGNLRGFEPFGEWRDEVTWPIDAEVFLHPQPVFITLADTDIEMVALAVGMHVVDLSIEWEQHLVRGEN